MCTYIHIHKFVFTCKHIHLAAQCLQWQGVDSWPRPQALNGFDDSFALLDGGVGVAVGRPRDVCWRGRCDIFSLTGWWTLLRTPLSHVQDVHFSSASLFLHGSADQGLFSYIQVVHWYTRYMGTYIGMVMWWLHAWQSQAICLREKMSKAPNVWLRKEKIVVHPLENQGKGFVPGRLLETRGFVSLWFEPLRFLSSHKAYVKRERESVDT